MSSPKNLHLPKWEKLRGADNYSEWKLKIEDIIDARYLGFHIMFDNFKPDPAKTKFEVYNKWTLRDTEASFAIRLNILPEVFQILQPRGWQAGDFNGTAYKLWSELEYLYGSPSPTPFEVRKYLEELLTVDFAKFKEKMMFSSVPAFILRFKKLVSALAETDVKLSEKAYIILFISAFQSSYEAWTVSWVEQYNSPVTLDLLYADITGLYEMP